MPHSQEPSDFHECARVIACWFGPLDAHGRSDAEHRQRWWLKDAAFDTTLRTLFLDLHAEIMRGARDAWLATALGRLGHVVVLDQFSRNMFRGTARMFASDGRALSAAIGGIELGLDAQLPLDQRMFFYMPLMHSEQLALQDRALQLYRATAEAQPDGELQAAVLGQLKYAEQHREIVRRFGRFPHRNVLLGRASSSAELEFLSQPGSSF